MVNNAQELGRFIASIANQQTDLRTNAFEDEAESTYLLAPVDSILLQTTVLNYKVYYPTDSFIIDHPVYGDIDSSTLNIDGGYRESGNTFPLEFPISFSELTTSELVSSYTS